MKTLEFNIFQKKIKKFLGNKNITTNIYRMKANQSHLRVKFCTGFIAFILKVKILLDCTNLFSTNEYQKSDKIIIEYFR